MQGIKLHWTQICILVSLQNFTQNFTQKEHIAFTHVIESQKL